MSLVLKSNVVYTGAELETGYTAYKQRVLADGGEMVDETKTRDAFLFSRITGLNSSKVFSATSPLWGVKTSGDKVVKLYSLFDSLGDINTIGGGLAVGSIGSTTGLKYPGVSSNYATSVGSFSKNSNIAMLSVVASTTYSPTVKGVMGLTDIGSVASARVVLRLDQDDTRVMGYYSGNGNTLSNPLVRDGQPHVLGVYFGAGELSVSADGVNVSVGASTAEAVFNTSLVMGKYNESVTSGIFAGFISETWVLKDGSFDDFNKIAKRLLSIHTA